MESQACIPVLLSETAQQGSGADGAKAGAFSPPLTASVRLQGRESKPGMPMSLGGTPAVVGIYPVSYVGGLYVYESPVDLSQRVFWPFVP